MDGGCGWSSLGWSHTCKEGGDIFCRSLGEARWRFGCVAWEGITLVVTSGGWAFKHGLSTGPCQRPRSLPSQASQGCVVWLGSSGPEGVADELWLVSAGWGSCYKSSVPQQPPSAAQVHTSASWVTSSFAGRRALRNARLSVKAFTVTVT